MVMLNILTGDPMSNVYSSAFLFNNLRDKGFLPSTLLSGRPISSVTGTQTFGESLETTDGISNNLKLLVLRCLALNPALRPTPDVLVALTLIGLTHSSGVGDHEYLSSLEVGLERVNSYWESDGDDEAPRPATPRPRQRHRDEHSRRSRRRSRSNDSSPDRRRSYRLRSSRRRRSRRRDRRDRPY